MHRFPSSLRKARQAGARRLGPLAGALLLAALHLPAHADLWAYVDEQGVSHFAPEKLDDRYQLFFKGADFDKLNLVKDGLASLNAKGAAQPLGEQPGFAMPKRFADMDQWKSYQAVQKHMRSAASKHGVDYALLKAVIATESGFDATAVSPKGAVGLMQLMPTTAGLYGVVADAPGRKDRKGRAIPAQSVEEKLTDPRTNIEAGARHLAYLLKLFKGQLDLAVAAYNAGEGAVQRAGNKVPNFRETQGYVKNVLGLYGLFKPSAGTAQPVARAAGQVEGRVRVVLGKGGGDARATPASPALPATRAEPAQPGTEPVLTPVTWRGAPEAGEGVQPASP